MIAIVLVGGILFLQVDMLVALFVLDLQQRSFARCLWEAEEEQQRLEHRIRELERAPAEVTGEIIVFQRAEASGAHSPMTPTHCAECRQPLRPKA